MEEIDKRLREATDACLAAHGEWATNKKNGPARERLMEAVHELRKVAARLEIELAVSERDEMAAKPLPIPPHRASRKRPGDANGDYGPEEDNAGNLGGSENIQDSGIARTMRRRRPGGPGGHPGAGGGASISRENMSSGNGGGGNSGGGNGGNNQPPNNGGSGNTGGRPPES